VGGDIALTALAAFPFCPDAYVALEPLCARLPVAAPPLPLLEALARILARPNAMGEPLDDEARALCEAEIARVRGSAKLLPHGRDLAESALQMLGERSSLQRVP
jgi:hypothetical protein